MICVAEFRSPVVSFFFFFLQGFAGAPGIEGPPGPPGRDGAPGISPTRPQSKAFPLFSRFLVLEKAVHYVSLCFFEIFLYVISQEPLVLFNR